MLVFIVFVDCIRYKHKLTRAFIIRHGYQFPLARSNFVTEGVVCLLSTNACRRVDLYFMTHKSCPNIAVQTTSGPLCGCHLAVRNERWSNTRPTCDVRIGSSNSALQIKGEDFSSPPSPPVSMLTGYRIWNAVLLPPAVRLQDHHCPSESAIGA